MKIASAFFLMIALTLPALAADVPKGPRNFIWGVSPQDVRTFEKAIFYQEKDNALEFLEDKKGRRILIRYEFLENKLWKISMEYVELYDVDYATMFDLVMAEQADLASVYGKPTNEELAWKSKKYKNHPKFWGRAFGYGDLKIVTEWQTKDSLARLTAYRDKNNGAFYHLGYTIEDGSIAAKQEAAKLRNVWETP